MKFVIPSAETIRQYGFVIIVNLSVFTTGMNLGWPSPMLVKLRDPDQTPLSRPITEEEGSWMVSAGFLCGAFTNLGVGMLLDTVGRKYSILLASLLKFFIGILFIFSTQVWMVIFGRAVVMSLETLLFSAVPVYSSEIAHKEQRGALGTLLQIFSSLGMVVSLSVGPYTSYVTFNMILTCAIAITTIPLLFLPDSPYYLYSKGRIDESREVLTLIRGSETLVREEIEGYEKAKESKVDVSKMALIRNRMFRKSLILSFMLGIGTTMIGFTAVTFYLQTILETTQVSLQPEISSVISGVIQLIGSACSTPFARNFGRKSILKVSLTGYTVGMVSLGIFFKVTEPEDFVIVGFLNYLPIISLVTVIYCYNVGIGSLYFLIAAELFDDIGRAFGFSIFLATTTFLTFLMTKYFFLMTNILGPAVTYWVFSGFTVLLIIMITLFLPETKGKTFNEIQNSIENGTKNGNVEKGLR